jgi:hypothetical protein
MDSASFISAVKAVNVGDGWQEAPIYVSHLNQAVYDVVEVNVHSNETFSLATTDEVNTITGGGLFVALDGCGVGGVSQPGSPSYTNAFPPVSGNVLMAYLYGPSQALAGSGDSFWRGHYGKHPSIYLHLKTVPGSYLGAAHLQRVKELYQQGTDPGGFRELGMEMLVGDPFMDLNH